MRIFSHCQEMRCWRLFHPLFFNTSLKTENHQIMTPSRPFLMAVSILCFVKCSLLQAAMPPAEALLPEDALFVFTIPDFDALREASRVSPQLMFWNDPAMKPFRDHFMDKINSQFLAPIQANIGIPLQDFMALPHGQLTFGMAAAPAGTTVAPPAFVFLLDAKDQSEALHTNLTALIKKWRDSGRNLRTEQIRGVDFTVLTLSSNDLAALLPQRPQVSEIGVQPKPEPPSDVYVAQYQSMLVAGNSEYALEPVVGHLRGGSEPALKDNPIFVSDQLTQFRDKPTYFAWMDVHHLVELAEKSGSDSGDDSSAFSRSQNMVKILETLGLDSLKSFSLTLRESRDGSHLNIHLNTPAENRTGLVSLLALPQRDASVPPFVPADVVKYSRLRLDGQQAWATAEKLVSSFSPSGLSYLNSIIDLANTSAQQKDPGFDLRSYLFGNLGDDLISYQEEPLGDTLSQMANPPNLTLFKVSHPDQVIQAINVIAAMVSSQEGAPEPRDYMGHKIYSIMSHPRHMPDGSLVNGPPLLVTSRGVYIALSTDDGMLEQYLRSTDGPSQPLSRLPGLADAIAQIGGDHGGFLGYENQAESLKTAFKLMKSTPVSGIQSRLMPPAMHDWFDFTLLPDFDLVARYFYISVYGESTTVNGIDFNVFSPRPPGLN